MEEKTVWVPWPVSFPQPDDSQNCGAMQPGNIPTGALIAKVGSGEIFKAGSKDTFTADKSGPLQFGIAMPGNYGGNEFPGEYQVKIRITHKPST